MTADGGVCELCGSAPVDPEAFHSVNGRVLLTSTDDGETVPRPCVCSECGRSAEEVEAWLAKYDPEQLEALQREGVLPADDTDAGR
jgi:hypothetical protein